jgi:poly(ADP-ribose) glycohydrolase ARH3
MNFTQDQFTGCMLGLATGDALGAPHEGGPLEKLVWRLIGKTRDGCLRFTDDTQMSLDLAESLLEENGLQPDALAKRFAASYHWSRGYGPGAAKVLKRIRRGQPWEQASKAVYAEGSYGNGAAMRAPVLALYFNADEDALLAAARTSALVTHAHPQGVDGAVLIAIATQSLLQGCTSLEVLDRIQRRCSTPEFAEKLKVVRALLEAKEMPMPQEVVSKLSNGIAAVASCPTALYIALRHLDQPFESLMQFTIACRGDVDTIAAMAGAMWGVVNGAARLPQIRLEARDRLTEVADRLFQRQQLTKTSLSV